MNILLIHGDDINSAYDRYIRIRTEAQSKNWQLISLDQNADIKSILNTPSLFAEKRLFILENIKQLNQRDLEWLINNQKHIPGHLLLYEKGVVSAAIINKLKGQIKIQEFKLPAAIFTFLDSIYPGSAEITLKHFAALSPTKPAELLLALMARRFKELFWVKTDPSSLNYEGWRIKKLKNQADRFSLGQLKQIISKLAQIDVESKQSSTDLKSSLELLIAGELA